VLLPSAIPCVLSGLGLLWLFLGTPFFRPFYGTIVLLVIAQVLGGITLSTQILKANFVQLGKELEEASRMWGAGFWRTYLHVVFPLMAQTMVLVGVIKFMFAAQHNSAIILLAPPKRARYRRSPSTRSPRATARWRASRSSSSRYSPSASPSWRALSVSKWASAPSNYTRRHRFLRMFSR
jgi:hypothetical protein